MIIDNDINEKSNSIDAHELENERNHSLPKHTAASALDENQWEDHPGGG